MTLLSEAIEAFKPVVLFAALTCSCAGVLVGLERNTELQQLEDAVAQWDALNAAASTANLTELRALYQTQLGPRPVVQTQNWTFIGAHRSRIVR